MSTIATTNGFHPPAAPKPTPPLGQEMKAQGMLGAGSEAAGLLMGLMGNMRVPEGTYRTYREMLTDPTIALAHAATSAPIIAAGYSVEADIDAPLGAKELVQDVFDKSGCDLVAESTRAIYQGNQCFEIVWEHQPRRTIIRKFKSLYPDHTTILVDDYGNLAGLEQHGHTIGSDKSLVITHDKQFDDWYGRSRMENIRRFAWMPWRDASNRLAQYEKKVAGTIPLIRYPVGSGYDSNGVLVDNYRIAVQQLVQLGQSLGVVMPSNMVSWGEDLLKQGADVASLLQWSIEFLEVKSDHAPGMIAAMGYWDILKVRGYLMPERGILQGTSGTGTKAESGVHKDVGTQISQQFLGTTFKTINEQAVDQLLSVNYGPQAKGKVYLTPGPIQDDALALYSSILTALYTGSPDLAMAKLDLNAMNEALELPTYEDSGLMPPMPLLPAPAPIPGAMPPTPPTPSPEIPKPAAARFARRMYTGRGPGRR